MINTQKLIPLSILCFLAGNICAENIIESNIVTAKQVPDRTVTFSVTDQGVHKPIIWGLDLAWLSEDNVRRGMNFMGKEKINIIRSSFTPTSPLVNGELPAAELATLKQRLNIIKLVSSNMDLVLNCDHPNVDEWFVGNAERWAQLIDVTARLHEEAGHNIVTVSPFNEPDYFQTGQGTINDFYNIAGELRKNSRFDNVRISGGNTLNNDEALPWYNTLKDRLDEGNTHQLAGSFDSYAEFYETVRANGHHASNDELHNVMEAMVGVEYGMQTGIWWGTAEYTRSEFVKISDGVRLGYAEHRPNWTAASVYRSPEGKVIGFGGTSERQAVETSYRFFSKDKDVYFDGFGPQREFIMTLPGGNGYQSGQANAEGLVNITWGEDIQPVIEEGKYIIVNRNSGMVMEVTGGGSNNGDNVRQNNYTGGEYQHWNITPVGTRIVGDFSYYTITAAHSNLSLDIYNWSLDDKGNIAMWDLAKGNNQQWYLEYAEDGYFYIRSKHSAKSIDVLNSSSKIANIYQFTKDDLASQQWRLIPVGADVEFEAPAAPVNLKAKANNVSVSLSWDANAETDLDGYNIYRAESAEGEYDMIARNVKTTSFTDNTANNGVTYYYKIKAVDKSLNRSEYSNVITSATTGEKDLVMHLRFENNLNDNSANGNHGSGYGSCTFTSGNVDDKAVSLSSSKSFIQLPANIANHKEITISAWIYNRTTSSWPRIFDFGNGENEYMFLTTRASSGNLRFGIKNNGDEQYIEGGALSSRKWTHIAVTLGESGARLYVNGEMVSEDASIKITPDDFKPALNYIGRSQFSDPLLNAYIDDFRVYNYELPAEKIQTLSDPLASNITEESITGNVSLWPLPANETLFVNHNLNCEIATKVSVFNISGQLVYENKAENNELQINVAGYVPGIYILKISNEKESIIEKFIVKH